MDQKITLKGLWEVLKNAGKRFSENKVPKLSGSLAYYTIFSLGPMLIIMIFLANLFWSKQAVEGKLVNQLSSLIGDKAAYQVQQIIESATVDGNNTLAIIIGIITLIIGATTVFSEIQDSINTIWRLKLKENTGWWKLVRTRLLSFSIVIGMGFLLLVSLLANALIEGLTDQLQNLFPSNTISLFYILNLLLTLIVSTILFGIIYKVLPDASIRWKDVVVGALFTAILFMIAKFGISFYIGKADMSSGYGAAGSLIVLLVWIYFSSMILYFGAEFTKAYTMKYGGEIKPNKFSVTIHVVEVESNEKSVQDNEKNEQKTHQQVQDDLNKKKKK